MGRHRLFGTSRAAGARPLRRTLWLSGAAALGLLVAYVPFFRSIAHAAGTDHHAGHVVYVPLFAIVLLVADRERVVRSIGRGEAGGATLTTLAAAFLGAAYAWSSVPLQAVSLVVAIAGLVWWTCGRRTVRTVSVTLAFLLLMLPPPRELVAAVAPAMQHFVAAFAAGALRALDIPVEREGIRLLLPGMTLEVVEECAGLRFALIVVVFASAFARLVLPTIGGQLTLVALAVPVAILTNATRVTALSAGAHVIGEDVISGPLHFQIGRGCWALGLLVIVAIAWALRSRTANDGRDAVSGHPREKGRGDDPRPSSLIEMAGSTGLEPATSGLTVQCANQAAPRARTAGD